MAKILHILNGDSLSEGIQPLELQGDVLIWREMLCAGPVTAEVGSDRFYSLRSDFLHEFYTISKTRYLEAFIEPLRNVGSLDSYTEINLWFEYDLFCHMNLLGALAWISQHAFKGKIYHVCSGRVKGSKKLLGLSELNETQLQDHYNKRKQLTENDLEIANDLWIDYTANDPRRIIQKITRKSSFDYLSNCLKSHVKRFPSVDTGLNVMEAHTLKLIQTHAIKSEHQLCGYVLAHQGYYGYGDRQVLRIIGLLRPFFGMVDKQLKLNEVGQQLLRKEINVLDQLESDYTYGGAHKYDWLYDADTNQLLKRL